MKTIYWPEVGDVIVCKGQEAKVIDAPCLNDVWEVMEDECGIAEVIAATADGQWWGVKLWNIRYNGQHLVTLNWNRRESPAEVEQQHKRKHAEWLERIRVAKCNEVDRCVALAQKKGLMPPGWTPPAGW